MVASSTRWPPSRSTCRRCCAWPGADRFAANLARAAKHQFRMDPQFGQPTYVEVLCEAEDLSPRLARVALGRGVHVYSGGGFDGLKAKRSFAERAARREVPTVVLTVTDLDDHGLGIFTAAAEDSIAWVAHYDPGRPGGWLRFQRIAVTEQQARDHDLLDDDGKAEVDGLPVPVMDQILLGAIDGLQDSAIREEAAATEERERAK